MPERAGIVTEITPPSEGRKQGTAKVDGRIVRFFWNAYESENPSDVRQMLEDAMSAGERVEVSGEERPNPRGEGPPMFIAKSVRLGPSSPPGLSQGPQTASYGQSGPTDRPGGETRRFVGRDPGEADFWLAMRWAFTQAVDLLRGEGVAIPSIDEIAKKADELFRVCYQKALEAHENLTQKEDS